VIALVEGPAHTKVKDLEADEVPVWPELLKRELLATLAACAALWLASLVFDAPLEELANPTLTPNPAKAPWYFLGLQELLVYFDPWIAGVMLPGLIILGLAAIPFLEPSGAAASAPRRRWGGFGFWAFTIGLFMWFALIVIGVYCRGPNWDWYWPWEDLTVMREARPEPVSLDPWLGAALLVVYTVVGFEAPRRLVPRFRALPLARYAVVSALTLSMLGVVLKITLRLLFDVKYVLETPWFNI
jgi:hypothetical protein